MSKKIKNLRMKDNSDSYNIKKNMIADLPMRAVILGSSGSGKTENLCNLILDPLHQFYNKDFKGDDIYIFSGSLETDEKIDAIIKCKSVPDENIFDTYDDEILNLVYDNIIEKVINCKENKIQPPNSLIILDDLSYSSKTSAHRKNAINRIFCNGRKNGCSIIYVSQAYTGIPCTSIRENSNLFILYNMSQRQLELAEADNNYLQSKKQFLKMFRDNVQERHDYMVINYTNKLNEMYLDKYWCPIDTSKYS